MKLLSHTPCDVASKQETNLASMVGVTVKVCLTLFHEIAPPAIMKMYLVLICESQRSQQSLSLNNQSHLDCLFVYT